MSRIRSQGTKLEGKLEEILKSIKFNYTKHPNMFGKPNFVYIDAMVAIFADSDFWHGFDWETKRKEIKTNKELWIKKIERNTLMREKNDNESEKDCRDCGALVGSCILKTAT